MGLGGVRRLAARSWLFVVETGGACRIMGIDVAIAGVPCVRMDFPFPFSVLSYNVNFKLLI